MTDSEKQVLDKAMQTWGFGGNFGMLVEECGELLAAMNQLCRGRVDENAVITELADVSLVLDAFASYFGYDKFAAERQRKLERLQKRLDKITDSKCNSDDLHSETC